LQRTVVLLLGHCNQQSAFSSKHRSENLHKFFTADYRLDGFAELAVTISLISTILSVPLSY
jgi:hypothetical protein